jgi:hypothetical protein
LPRAVTVIRFGITNDLLVRWRVNSSRTYDEDATLIKPITLAAAE